MLPSRCRQYRQGGMQKEVISDMSHHNSSTFSADYNTTWVPTINCAKGFALHSDLSETYFGRRREKCGLRSGDKHYTYYREAEKSSCCSSQCRVCSSFWRQSRALGSEGMKSLKWYKNQFPIWGSAHRFPISKIKNQCSPRKCLVFVARKAPIRNTKFDYES